MTGKIKRRSLRCGGRPKADFGSLFTSVIAPALNVAGSIADESIDNNKTITIPSDPTKTPTMRLGGRKKCWIGAAIGAATSIAGSLFGNGAQKREMRRQQSIRDWQNATQEAANMTNALNNSQDYQEDYLRQFRTAARLGKTLGAKGIYITDGGDATKIGNNTYLLRGGSHEDVNETGQTGIGINVGGNEVEAEGGEVAQKKNGALRIFSAQPILSNGMSPAQAILRGYNKDSVFSQQQAFKKRNGLKDDGSKLRNGGLTSKDRGSSKHPYPSVSSKDFAGGGRSYPIPTKADAVDALSYDTDNNIDAVMAPAFGTSSTRVLSQLAKSPEASYTLKQALGLSTKEMVRKRIAGDIAKRIGVARAARQSSNFRNYNIARMQAANAEASFSPFANQVRYAEGKPVLVNTNGYYTTAGNTISRNARNMTSGANPFLYAPRTSDEVLEGLNRVISSAKQGAKSAGQKVGNKFKGTPGQKLSDAYYNLTPMQRAKLKGMRPKAPGGMYIPFNKRYSSIYDAPDYDSDYNGGNVLGDGEVTVTAKRIKPTFMKPNNDAMNLIKVPKEEVPYIPQKYNRSRTIFSGGDYLGLGIDTLAALSTGLVNYNTAGKYTLPDRAPIIQASKLPTTYNVNPEIEEVKRYRDRLTGQTFNNTSSSVAALNRSGAINLDALSNLSKLWATKENEENKMLTEDAKNQQTVAAQNVQNELARQSEIARIKNEATQAKGDALNVGLSGLSQAWTNFWTAGRTAYEDDQARRAMIASSKEATPTRLSEMDFDLSPDILASLYRTAKDDRTRRFYLSRLSPKQRQKYGIN